MTKLLAIVAAAFCVSNAQATELPEPVKALVSTVKYTAAVPVQVTQSAWNRINENSQNANLMRLIAEDTTKCIGGATQPGEIPACTLDMGGSFVTAIWSTAGYFVADVAEIGLGLGTNIIGAWSKAFNYCFESTKANLLAPVGYACKIVSFALDAAGFIVGKVAGLALVALTSVVDGVGAVLSNAFALPAALLRGDIESAFRALFNIVRAVVVCVVPVAPIVVALIHGNDAARALCSGKKKATPVAP